MSAAVWETKGRSKLMAGFDQAQVKTGQIESDTNSPPKWSGESAQDLSRDLV